MPRIVLALVLCCAAMHGAAAAAGTAKAANEGLASCLDPSTTLLAGGDVGDKELMAAQNACARLKQSSSDSPPSRESTRRRRTSPTNFGGAKPRNSDPRRVTPTRVRADRSGPTACLGRSDERSATWPAATGARSVRCGGSAWRSHDGLRSAPQSRPTVRRASRAIWAQARAYNAARADSDLTSTSYLMPPRWLGLSPSLQPASSQGSCRCV